MANLVYMAKSAWTGLLDAIRAKAGTAASMTVSEATTAVQNIPTGGGGGEDYEKLVMRTISVASGSMSTIGVYAYYSCPALTTASFPAATVLSNSAFNKCSSLTTVNFPAATTIGSYAFVSCYALTTVNFPAATVINNFAFNECTKLTTASFPAATTIGANIFTACTKLTTASFPAATIIGSYAFRNCYHLTSLYLTGGSMAELVHVNAFSSTPISGYTASTGGVYGSIFVPASLYDSYISASNWSYYSERFVSV